MMDGRDGATSKIINRYSRQSPFYNPNLTRFDRIQASIRPYTTGLIIYKCFPQVPNFIDTELRHEESSYIMEYYIGSPAVLTYGVLDTGSSLTWLQCLPCDKCSEQTKVPIFDPAKSSTYHQLSCKDIKCAKMIDTRRCGIGAKCLYTTFYLDGSYTIGLVAEETLIFPSGDENFTVPNVVKMVIMDTLINISGDKTPMHFLEDNHYYVSLEGISVDDKRLLIPNDTFSFKKSNKGGCMVDTGSTFTYLVKAAFDILVEHLNQEMENVKRAPEAEKKSFFKLCYEIGWADLMFIPVLTLHFTDADLHLPSFNTWLHFQQDTYCLAILPTDGRSTLGNFQMQRTTVGYDLENEVISFNVNYCSE
ncbi:LOW QUALITY PROTEIN: hypothetical protein AQUCO_03700151v1 [Aquilegia coerulea]|uniref:Peptidase A1 domain-containing protein n=1 Tax=Aquilegia coerulea TaxID=218851 RepID=A0A2G5CTQ6_AQUCA|nr:LOW QUALITY PROTEIN: hypothetical protein AQUCO_03700151v1 [Aquilegia coerulea]